MYDIVLKYLDHAKGHTNTRFGIIAYPKKPLIIAHSGMSRATRCLKVVRSLLQLANFVYARSEIPGKVMLHAGSSEPSPHADVIRIIISCADQFIVLIFHCGPFILFYYSVYTLNS